MSGVEISGISTLLNETSGLPSRAQRARRLMESFSPRLMLSSEVEWGRSGRATPIISADSWRVETDERRRWWEFRFEGGIGWDWAGGLGDGDGDAIGVNKRVGGAIVTEER